SCSSTEDPWRSARAISSAARGSSFTFHPEKIGRSKRSVPHANARFARACAPQPDGASLRFAEAVMGLLARSSVVGCVAFLIACGSKGPNFDGGEANPNWGNPFPDDDPGTNPGDAEMNGDGGMPVEKCHVPPDNPSGNAPQCQMKPQPPNSFNPVIKWKF